MRPDLREQRQPDVDRHVDDHKLERVPTGGGQDQLRFGAGGLTNPQLAAITFTNPAGFPAGTYGRLVAQRGSRPHNAICRVAVG